MPAVPAPGEQRSPTDPQAEFPASGLGVDHRTVHLNTPDEGVVVHDFAPGFPC